jgi:PA14 domain
MFDLNFAESTAALLPVSPSGDLFMAAAAHPLVAALPIELPQAALANEVTPAVPIDLVKAAGVAPAAVDPLTGNGLGLMAEYYDNPDFTNLKKTNLDAKVDFNWGAGSPNKKIGVDSFAVRWTGKIQPRYSETYTFKLSGDDGVRLWVNGRQIINAWPNTGLGEKTGQIALTAGQKYDIAISARMKSFAPAEWMFRR